MKLNDLKLGTITELNGSYAVVLGIATFPDYEKRFVAKDAYEYIPIVLYKLAPLSYTSPGDIVINNVLTATMQEGMDTDLIYTTYMVQVNLVDMKSRTKEIQTWLMKNKLFHPSVFDDILDVEDRKKRLNNIITKRENYYNFLWKKLSCYDNGILSLERNFDKLKFGEIYVSKDYFCIGIIVQKSLFYCIERNGNLKKNISSFILTCMPDEIMFGCRKMSPNLLYDTGVNIMTYWWNKENYEWIKEREKWQ